MPFQDTILRPLLAGLIAGLALVALARMVAPAPDAAFRSEFRPMPQVDDADPPSLRGFP